MYYNKCFLSVFIDYNNFCYCEVIIMVLTCEMMHDIVHIIFVILQREMPNLIGQHARVQAMFGFLLGYIKARPRIVEREIITP